MYYKELMEMRLSLLLTYRALKKDKEANKKAINEIASRIVTINNKLTSGLIKNYYRPDKEALREYKKAFKHEFLNQVNQGYPLENIIDSIDFLIPNPGLNPRYCVKSLSEKGFIIGDIDDPNAILYLTPKAERYLENEANISLKCK